MEFSLEVQTHLFITLIAKYRNPQNLSQFRPIFLVGCLYKILAKVLAIRMRRVIGKVIDNCQSAFVKKRQLLNSVLIANEVVDAKKEVKGHALFSR